MGKPNFSDEFKRDAEAQITERGYKGADPFGPGLPVHQHGLGRLHPGTQS
jgi:transposase